MLVLFVYTYSLSDVYALPATTMLNKHVIYIASLSHDSKKSN